MSDEEEEDQVVEGYDGDEGGGSGSGGSGSDGEGSGQGPCSMCVCGLIFLVIAVGGLWTNEGRFVKTMKALDAVNERYVSPCTGSCSSCDFNSVEDPKTKQKRALKNGEEVYMACDIQGLKDIGSLTQGKFDVPELQGLLKASNDQQKSFQYKWEFELYQETYEAGEADIPNLTRTYGGKYKNNPNAYCAYKRKSVCDPFHSQNKWTAGPPRITPLGAVTTTTAASPAVPTTTTAASPSPATGGECKELNKVNCAAKPDKCEWDYKNCGKVTSEDECRALPGECQWAATTIRVKDKDCKGCCQTDTTWKFACKEKSDSGPVVPTTTTAAPTTTTAAPTTTTEAATTTTEVVPDPVPDSECKELNKANCQAKSDTCEWEFTYCPTITDEAQCRKLGPIACQWAANTIQVKGKACKGCCQTDDSWKAACKLKPGGQVATTTTPASAPVPAQGGDCQELNRAKCQAKPDTCEWQYTNCPKITDEAQCRKLGPIACQWAANTITVQGKGCKGCCPTEDSWKVACKQKPGSQVATTTTPASAPMPPCQGLSHTACDTVDKCVWEWRCPKITDQAKCRSLGPDECQWAANTIQVKGKDCKGCCPTERTAKVACKSKAELECREQRKDPCLAKADTCIWDWRCPKIKDEAECRKLGPIECQWAANTIKVSGKDCKGCCSTDTTWSVSCKPKPASEAADSFMAFSLEEDAHEIGEEDKDESEDREADDVVRSLRGNQSAVAAPRRLAGKCKWTFCKRKSEWLHDHQNEPTLWDMLPEGTSSSRSLQYVNQAAYNLKVLEKKMAVTEAWLGTKGSTRAQGLGLDMVVAKGVLSDFRAMSLASHTPTATLESKVIRTTYAYNKDKSKTIELVKLDRSDPASAWTSENSRIGGTCQTGCICSSDHTEPGSIRVCFKRLASTQLSIIAKVETDANGNFRLVDSPDVGMLTKVDAIVSADDLLQAAKDSAKFWRKIFRYVLPLVMWLGIYCCLSPLVWVIDKFGDALETIPCFGGFLGGMVEMVETLAECAICIVSCCGALSCSLLVASLAWVWFRPQVGIPLLICSLALFAGLIYFAMSRKGAQKVRKRPSSRRSARQVPIEGGGVEMRSTSSNQVPAAPVQFAVVCPDGVYPGGLVQVQAPDGRMVQVQVPEGVEPGQQFAVAA